MSELLTALSIIFIVAGPFLLLANRLDVPAAPLLIVAGVVAGVFVDEALAFELAQFGIALLVFFLGMGIQLSDVRTILADSERAALGQILVVGSLGFGFGLLVGLPQSEALFVGVAAALSSTMVGTALLQTEIRRNLIHGRLADSMQFVQDLFAVAFVLVVSAGSLAADPIALKLGYGLVFLVAAYFVNGYVFDAVDRLAGDSDELLIVGIVSLLVVFIGAAAAADLPIVVGAFAAGLAVKYDPTEHLGVFNGMESIKDFFVAVFFVTVGALVALPFVHAGPVESVEKLALAGGIVLLAVVVKPAVTTAILIYRGYEGRTSALVGLSSDQVSEFSLIIAIQGLITGVLTPAVFDAIVLAAAVTMITSPLSQPYSERIYRLLADRGVIRGRHGKVDELSSVPDDLSDHVIIVGYGRKGRRLVETVEALDRPYVVIENDPAVREDVRIDCGSYVFGDAMEEYTWEKANVEEARAVVSLTSSRPVSNRLLRFGFDAPLVLRAPTEREALELLDDGATYVIVPDLLAGEQLNRLLGSLLDGDISSEELRSEGLATLEEHLDRKERFREDDSDGNWNASP